MYVNEIIKMRTKTKMQLSLARPTAANLGLKFEPDLGSEVCSRRMEIAFTY